jgi:hypothetical protein
VSPFRRRDPDLRPKPSFRPNRLKGEARTDMNRIKAARLLAALAVVLVTVGGCGDLYCGVPKGDNVNVLGDQSNR